MTGTMKPRREFMRKGSARELTAALDWSTRFLLRGAHAKALEITSVAIEHHPDNAAILTRHGDALHMSGQITEARDAYRRACALDETEFQTWYGWGCAEFAFEAYADAIG